MSLELNLAIGKDEAKIFQAMWADLRDRLAKVMSDPEMDVFGVEHFLFNMDKVVSFFEDYVKPDPPYTLDSFLKDVVNDMAMTRSASGVASTLETELEDHDLEFADGWWMLEDFIEEYPQRIRALLVDVAPKN